MTACAFCEVTWFAGSGRDIANRTKQHVLAKDEQRFQLTKSKRMTGIDVGFSYSKSSEDHSLSETEEANDLLRVNLVNPLYQNEPVALGPQGDDCIRLREEVLFSFLENSLLEDLIKPILGANVHAVMTSIWLAQESSDAVGKSRKP